jgi:hypothetical protein
VQVNNLWSCLLDFIQGKMTLRILCVICLHVNAQICGNQKLCVQFAHGWKSDNIPKCVIPYNKNKIETILKWNNNYLF